MHQTQRIVIVAVGTYGDVLPLLAVARRLREQWAEVTPSRRQVVFISHGSLLENLRHCGALPEMDDSTTVEWSRDWTPGLGLTEPAEAQQLAVELRKAARSNGLVLPRVSMSTEPTTPANFVRSDSDSSLSDESFTTAISRQWPSPKQRFPKVHDGEGSATDLLFAALDTAPIMHEASLRRRPSNGRSLSGFTAEASTIAEALVHVERLRPTAALIVNLFSVAAIHAAHISDVPALVISPSAPPAPSSASFMSQLRSDSLNDAAVEKAHQADTNTVCVPRAAETDTGSRESQMARQVVQRLSARNPFVVSLKDIHHWMWRLLLDDHGNIRRALGLSESIFDPPFADSPRDMPGIPVLYLMHPVLCADGEPWPPTCQCVGMPVLFPARDFTAEEDSVVPESCTRSGGATPRGPRRGESFFGDFGENAGCLLKVVRFGDDGRDFCFTASAEAMLKRPDFVNLPVRLIEEWLQKEPDHDKCFVFVTFGSMHSESAAVVPQIDTLVQVMLKATDGMAVKFLLHVPVHDAKGLALKTGHARSWDTKVLVILGVVNAEAIAAHPGCQALVCHGGAGITAMGVRHGVPMVVVPLMFDQFANAKALEWNGHGITSWTLSYWVRVTMRQAVPVNDTVFAVVNSAEWAAGRLVGALARVLADEPCKADLARQSKGTLRRPRQPDVPDGAAVAAEVVLRFIDFV
eukprot:Polyplicarium_translucidae@DN3244_c0_g1_i3.p1